MYEIMVTFIDGEKRKFIGNFTIEGAFIRINYDHDNNKKTPQHTSVFPVHYISEINCEVIQSGIR